MDQQRRGKRRNGQTHLTTSFTRAYTMDTTVVISFAMKIAFKPVDSPIRRMGTAKSTPRNAQPRTVIRLLPAPCHDARVRTE